MEKERNKHFHFIYGIILSVTIIVAGICLMGGCVSIYLSGDQPFSRESVGAAFSPIAVPVILCLVMIVVGFILDLTAAKDGKNSYVLQHSEILKRLRQVKDLNSCEEAQYHEILALRKAQRNRSLITAALLCIASIVFLCYALQVNSFHASEINESMAKAVLILAACLAIPFVWSIFAAFKGKCDTKKEIDLLKQLPSRQERAAAPSNQNSAVAIARILILCIGIGLLLYGLNCGGTADVLTKAINICTECVGLG